MKIKGKKISIRDWQHKDLVGYKYWNSGQYLWMDFNGPYYAKLSPEKLKEIINAYEKQIEEESWETPRKKLVIADIETDQFIGTVNWYWQSQETNWKSIGIVIYDDQYWGKGLGYEALKFWMQYLFTHDKTIARLDLRTWSGHKGMIKLAKKLGFLEEACFRKARIVKGAYYDSIGMGILREEWESRKT